MRLAAIDLGSNSVHMVIADVSADGRIEVIDRVKEMVRLGRRAFTTGKLGREARDLATQAVATFGRLARVRGVRRLRAVATSAVREAHNGAAFVRRLRRATGVPVEVISGLEEARLIFRAVRHAMALEGGPHLLVDVGGGSVELTLVEDCRVVWMRSLPLGVARLSDRFLRHDPPTGREIRALERHVESVLRPLLTRARLRGVADVIGTSGTINTLVGMARAFRGDDSGRLHGAGATREELRLVRRRILTTDAETRADLPGMDPKRTDLMPAAAVLVGTLLARLEARELRVCGWALREGILLELAEVGQAGAAQRRRSVLGLARRYAVDNAHGRHVARLAVGLFDALGPRLGLPPSSRELLEFAGLLHDIGHAIDHARHHRHTQYLIRNAELLGFDPVEVDVLALVARGHRKQVPRVSDPDMAPLPGSKRRLVRGLAALLRVADALDRTRSGVVRGVRASWHGDRLVLELDVGAGNADLEVWAAERRVDLLARLLDQPVVLRAPHRHEPALRRAL